MCALLLSSHELTKTLGGRTLFDHLSFTVELNDRIGLIGSNGSGKSTLLKILANLEFPDEGYITKGKHLQIAYVSQESAFPERSLLEIMLENLKVEILDPKTKALILLTKIGFTDPHRMATTLSGGWQKRLALSRALMEDPDLLLIDEPTNHLDIEGVLWLEKFLMQTTLSYIVVSHDRYFLERVTNKTMELSKSYPKGHLLFEGPYHIFLEKKEIFLSGQKQQEASLSSKVRREVEWLAQNPKARTTKSQSRIQEANRLIDQLETLKKRNITEQAEIGWVGSGRESKRLVSVTNLGFSWEDRPLFNGIHFTLSPGVRLGIVGLNGSGKTTLLKILAGEQSPQKGTIKYADSLKIAYFDQHRTLLDPSLTLRRALAPTGDTISYRGQSIHVNGWCRRFLFEPERLDLPVGWLSGGEKARVALARFMLQPADLLLLDEPTNDLDLATLELLQQSLVEFPGAVVLISHDRYLLEQVSTAILGLGTETDNILFASYSQWENHWNNRLTDAKKKEKEISKPENIREKGKKMSYKEKRELEEIEGKITSCEEKIVHLTDEIANLHATSDAEKTGKLYTELHSYQDQLEKLYTRWEELENKSHSES